MEQRDYLLRQIEQMTQALVSLIRKLFGLSNPNDEEEALQSTETVLKEFLDISFEELLQLPGEELSGWLQKQNPLNEENLDLLAEIIILNAKIESTISRKKQLLKLARVLLLWNEERSGTYSIIRNQKLAEIEMLGK